ncbi:MAG: hypothetical protein JXA30_20660 [Deltaproteobacteria bacterium]|nr:hypothetical protein [Deltaproteobacteria bacterium]
MNFVRNGFFLAILPLVGALHGCNGGDSGENGGGGKCAVEACGGDVVGDWEIESICLENPEKFVSLAGMPSECSDMFKSFEASPEGTITFGEKGTGKAEISLAFDIEVSITESCLKAMGGSSVSELYCSLLESGLTDSGEFREASCEVTSNHCDCLVTTTEHSISSGGAYRVDGEHISDDSGEKAPFCVSGDTLEMGGESHGVAMSMVFRRI